MRIITLVACAFISLFCIFGFLASGEVAGWEMMFFRTLYGVVFLGAASGAVRLVLSLSRAT